MSTVKPNLPDGEGEVWLMVDLGAKEFRDDADRAFAETVINFIEANDLGEWDGESSGAHQMDVSFVVSDVRATARALDDHLNKHYPELRYFISDDYETTFDRK